MRTDRPNMTLTVDWDVKKQTKDFIIWILNVCFCRLLKCGLSKYYKDTQTTQRHAKTHKDRQRHAKTRKDAQRHAKTRKEAQRRGNRKDGTKTPALRKDT